MLCLKHKIPDRLRSPTCADMQCKRLPPARSNRSTATACLIAFIQRIRLSLQWSRAKNAIPSAFTRAIYPIGLTGGRSWRSEQRAASADFAQARKSLMAAAPPTKPPRCCQPRSASRGIFCGYGGLCGCHASNARNRCNSCRQRRTHAPKVSRQSPHSRQTTGRYLRLVTHPQRCWPSPYARTDLPRICRGRNQLTG